MCSAQIVVVFMSLGFIGFVTVLHIIGKVSAVSMLRSCCNCTAGLNECVRHTCKRRMGKVAQTMTHHILWQRAGAFLQMRG